MKKFTEICNKISLASSALCCIALIIIVVLTIADIIGRYFFKSSILGTMEIIQMFLSVVFFFSVATGQNEKSHIYVYIFLNKLPKKAGNIICFIENLLSLAIAVFMSVSGFQQGIYALGKNLGTTLLKIPHYPFYFLEGIAFALFVIVLILDVIKSFLAISKEEYSKEIRSYWHG